MMKNLLFVYICLFGLALPLSAQKLDAQDILDRTATAFRQAGGIQADFTVQTYAKGALQGSSVGTIRLKGEKFLLDADGVKTWFDGRTQWSYLTNSDEVNVSEPTPEELQKENLKRKFVKRHLCRIMNLILLTVSFVVYIFRNLLLLRVSWYA